MKTADSKAPRVSRIKQAIRGQVQSGQLQVGEKLPSLAELAKLFDCSLGLVRQAINTLVAEGLLTSEPRRGIYVAANRPAVSDIMLVLPTAHMENMQRLFEGVRMGLEQSPYRVVLHAANFDYDEQMAMLGDLDLQSVAGVLILPPPLAKQAKPLMRISQQGMPVVQVARSLINLDMDAVVADGVEMGRIAMEHLLSIGHRRIGYVCNRADHHLNRELLDGFEMALKPHGLTMDDVAIGLVSATDLNSRQPWLNGQIAAANLLEEHPDRTAIIGMNPHLTLGVYKAVQQSGKAVGADVSVLGLFADLSYLTALEPAISVVCCDLQQIGQRAAMLLRQRIQTPGMQRRSLCISPHLIARQSVQPVK